jgi:glutamate-1-semialdehyde 2,1-aminomutase
MDGRGNRELTAERTARPEQAAAAAPTGRERARTGEPPGPRTGEPPGVARVRELLAAERARFEERTPASRELAERARRALAGGVVSSFHAHDPWPIYIARGEGARVWDADGNEYIDFHNGFSAMVQGHAHPAVGAAVRRRYELGTHFGATTEDAVAVAEELTRRFGMDSWRFANSGTEANMAAVRIARAFTGREGVVTMTGAYHGHADLGELSTVAWGEVATLARRLEETRPACVLMEAAMTSGGLTLPEPGYLDAVRELTRSAGAVLILDEVKTGLTIAAGGACERFGIRPDLLTLAKSLGAGLPSGAIGMSAELAELVADGRVRQLGTFNGNPLSMAAAAASLREVLTPAAYAELERLGARMVAGCERVLEANGLEATCVGLGSKGCVRWDGDPERAELVWLWLANRGLFATPRREQEWNLTVVHDDKAVDRYLEAFGELAAELTPRSSGSARA